MLLAADGPGKVSDRGCLSVVLDLGEFLRVPLGVVVLVLVLRLPVHLECEIGGVYCCIKLMGGVDLAHGGLPRVNHAFELLLRVELAVEFGIRVEEEAPNHRRGGLPCDRTASASSLALLDAPVTIVAVARLLLLVQGHHALTPAKVDRLRHVVVTELRLLM